MSASSSIVRRALLYVPGSSQKMLDKSRGLTVDCVAYDLEDSVASEKKSEARANISSLLALPRVSSIREHAVRINSIGSGLEEDDLNAVCNAPDLDTVVVPKVNSGSDLRWATDFIKQNRAVSSKPLKLLALIESARAITELSQICTASSLLSGLIFAAEDFALDLSLTRTPSLTEFLYARSAIVTAARAHNIPSTIDLVCTMINGPEGTKRLHEECVGGKGLGFNGKQCIHPTQIGIVQKCFAPSTSEIEWAVRVVIANKKAKAMGKGAWVLDGKMIDAPVIGKAKSLTAMAEACELDVSWLMDKWSQQEPE